MSYWFAQFFGWGLYCLFLLMAAHTAENVPTQTEISITLITVYISGIFFSHIQRWVILKFGWLTIKLQRVLPRLLISSILLSILITAVAILSEVIFRSKKVTDISMANFIAGLVSVVILMLLWNSFYFIYHYIRKSRRQEISNLALEASNKESELKNLRSQLNPHFLFNSLNSIRALIEIEPQKAKKSITTLSNLLRQSLILGKENLVDLEMELEICHSYLELEKIRFEERLDVEYHIDDRLYG
ncbi:MAG: histidine kinase, partial [Crocinitomicaceae bacterium]|nr:histidine kinase [Crocinitomicaceae bacterium]